MSPVYGDVVRDAATRLAGVTDSPRLDTELLLAHALGISRDSLLTRLRDSGEIGNFYFFLERRLRHEPIAYILGYREFFSLEMAVRPPILIPRPETEHLVEVALDFIDKNTKLRVLDLCTGTGCISVAIAANSDDALVTGTDIAPGSISLAQENARRHNVHTRFFEGDLFAALPGNEPPFDVILSNPPYVETAEWGSLAPDICNYEDPGALLAGEDGLDVIRRIVAEAPKHLNAGGLLALEIGETQYPSVADLYMTAGFVDVHPVLDLAGIKRVAVGIREK